MSKKSEKSPPGVRIPRVPPGHEPRQIWDFSIYPVDIFTGSICHTKKDRDCPCLFFIHIADCRLELVWRLSRLEIPLMPDQRQLQP